jgi:hypothetical protein
MASAGLKNPARFVPGILAAAQKIISALSLLPVYHAALKNRQL